jgi:hypothetical protein
MDTVPVASPWKTLFSSSGGDGGAGHASSAISAQEMRRQYGDRYLEPDIKQGGPVPLTKHNAQLLHGAHIQRA